MELVSQNLSNGINVIRSENGGLSSIKAVSLALKLLISEPRRKRLVLAITL